MLKKLLTGSLRKPGLDGVSLDVSALVLELLLVSALLTLTMLVLVLTLLLAELFPALLIGFSSPLGSIQ